jgi:Sodium/hydrogen exchanger family
LKTIAGILLLAVLALAGHRKSFVTIASGKAGGFFFLTGTEFLLVGYLLSDSFLGILDASTLNRVRPFLILGLGWIGLLSGIQLEWSALRGFGRSSYVWTLLYGCFLLLFVSLGLYALLRFWFPYDPQMGLAVAVLAVTALCTAQASIALWMRNVPEEKRPLGLLLQFVSSINDVIAIVLFGLLVGFYQPAEGAIGLPLLPLEKFLLSLLVGVLMGMFMLLLFRTRLGGVDKILIVIGLVLFGGGMAYLLGISPLLVHLVAGVILANFSLKSEETFQLLMRIEKPLYLIFLMMGGAYLRIVSPLVVLLAVAYVALRALSQAVAGGIFLGRVFRGTAHRPTRALGWGFLSQAGIGVALAVHFQLWIADPSSLPILEVTFSVLLLAIVFNELISPFGLAYVTKEE